jgi:hypothetical protein
LKKLVLQGFNAGLADNSTVALHFDDHELELVVAKPNDERWSYLARSELHLDSKLDSSISTLSFKNRLYCITKKGIKVLDFTSAGQLPQLTAIQADEGFLLPRYYVNLVDNDDKLILVGPMKGSKMQRYDVHWVDLDAHKMVPMYGLHGRAVFLCDSGAGRGRSLSVHARRFSSIRANAIYRCRNERCETVDGRPRIDVFHLKHGQWIEHNLLVQPGSIIDYLSRYVCRSPDIVVPAPQGHMAAACPRKRMPQKRKANSMVIGNEWVN